MNKAFRMDLLLVRKRFSIYGLFNILSLVLVLGLLLFGMKAGILLLGHPLQTYLLLLLMIFLSPIPDVSYSEIGVSQKRMMVFFKSIPLNEVQNYYLYKKLIFLYIIAIYLFFPIHLIDLPYFFYALIMIGLYTTLTTTAERYGNKSFATNSKFFCKYGFTLVAIAYFRGIIPDLHSFVIATNRPTLLMIALVLFVVTFLNIRKIYTRENKEVRAKVFFQFIKNKDILFILRTNLIFDLSVLFLLATITFKNQLFDGTLFMYALLSSYLTIYYSILNVEAHKIPYFFKANQLKNVRKTKIISILKFSVIYLLLMLIFGFFLKNISQFLLYYALSFIAFVGPALLIKINLEKRQGGKIITAKDFLKIAAISILLLIVFHSLL